MKAPKRTLALATVPLIATIAISLFALMPRSASAAPSPWSDTMAYGMPATPQQWQPSNWDIQTHVRDRQSVGMDPMNADHGADCSPPPAKHPISTWQQAVFICHDHIMTAINNGGYGEVVLTPDHMADWANGPVTVSFSLSTMRTNARDWFTISLTPFGEQLSVPFDFFGVDLEGMPLHYVSVREDMDTVGSNAYTHWKILREQTGQGDGTDQGDMVNDQGWPFFEGTTHIPMSASVRTPFEFTFDSTHYLFRVGPTSAVAPGAVLFQGNFPKPMTFTRGVLQFAHHSYDAEKCDVFGVSCGPNTWHISNIGISSAVPYTLLRPTDHQVVNGTTSPVTFPSPAPAGSFLKFVGKVGTQVSFDGGKTFVNAVRQKVDPAYANNDPSHDANFMSPVPAGVTQVFVKSAFARDFSLVSETVAGSPTPPPPSPTATTPPPTPTSTVAPPTPTPVPPTPTPVPPTPTPTPVGTPIHMVPCTVTINGVQQTGLCDGTFYSNGGGSPPPPQNPPAALTSASAISNYSCLAVTPGPITIVNSHLSSGPLTGATIYHTPWHNDATKYIDDRLIAFKSQHWNLVRPTDQWDSGDDPYNPTIWANMDHLVCMAAALGMYVQIDLSGYRRILQGQGKDVWTAANWTSFIDQVVAHYHNVNNVALFSVIGEANFPTTQAAADSLVAFYRDTLNEIKRVDGHRHLVIAGGFIHMQDGVSGWWKPIFALEDLAAFKIYSLRDEQYVPTIRAAAGGKPLFNDEFGMPQYMGDGTWSGQTYNGLKVSRASFYKTVLSYGFDGNVVWNQGNEVRPDTYDVGPQTPFAWSALKR